MKKKFRRDHFHGGECLVLRQSYVAVSVMLSHIEVLFIIFGLGYFLVTSLCWDKCCFEPDEKNSYIGREFYGENTTMNFLGILLYGII